MTDVRWFKLNAYLEEVDRGLVHTEEWKKQMAELQAERTTLMDETGVDPLTLVRLVGMFH